MRRARQPAGDRLDVDRLRVLVFEEPREERGREVCRVLAPEELTGHLVIHADEVRADEAGVDAEQPDPVQGELAEPGDDHVRIELGEIPEQRVRELGGELDLGGKLAGGDQVLERRDPGDERGAHGEQGVVIGHRVRDVVGRRRLRNDNDPDVEWGLGGQHDLAADVAVERRSTHPHRKAGLLHVRDGLRAQDLQALVLQGELDLNRAHSLGRLDGLVGNRAKLGLGSAGPGRGQEGGRRRLAPGPRGPSNPYAVERRDGREAFGHLLPRRDPVDLDEREQRGGEVHAIAALDLREARLPGASDLGAEPPPVELVRDLADRAELVPGGGHELLLVVPHRAGPQPRGHAARRANVQSPGPTGVGNARGLRRPASVERDPDDGVVAQRVVALRDRVIRPAQDVVEDRLHDCRELGVPRRRSVRDQAGVGERSDQVDGHGRARPRHIQPRLGHVDGPHPELSDLVGREEELAERLEVAGLGRRRERPGVVDDEIDGLLAGRDPGGLRALRRPGRKGVHQRGPVADARLHEPRADDPGAKGGRLVFDRVGDLLERARRLHVSPAPGLVGRRELVLLVRLDVQHAGRPGRPRVHDAFGVRLDHHQHDPGTQASLRPVLGGRVAPGEVGRGEFDQREVVRLDVDRARRGVPAQDLARHDRLDPVRREEADAGVDRIAGEGDAHGDHARVEAARAGVRGLEVACEAAPEIRQEGEVGHATTSSIAAWAGTTFNRRRSPGSDAARASTIAVASA